MRNKQLVNDIGTEQQAMTEQRMSYPLLLPSFKQGKYEYNLNGMIFRDCLPLKHLFIQCSNCNKRPRNDVPFTIACNMGLAKLQHDFIVAI